MAVTGDDVTGKAPAACTIQGDNVACILLLVAAIIRRLGIVKGGKAVALSTTSENTSSKDTRKKNLDIAGMWSSWLPLLLAVIVVLVWFNILIIVMPTWLFAVETDGGTGWCLRVGVRREKMSESFDNGIVVGCFIRFLLSRSVL